VWRVWNSGSRDGVVEVIVEAMDDLREQLDSLERAIADLDKACKQALGFAYSIEYEGIAFHVGKRFVVADLSPLGFLHLVEPIDESTRQEPYGAIAAGAQAAVVRLYERMLPLLSCVHQWTPLSRIEDRQLRLLQPDGPRQHICKACTAYALEGSLPAVGRGATPK
jgi:hypothetical protein